MPRSINTATITGSWFQGLSFRLQSAFVWVLSVCDNSGVFRMELLKGSNSFELEDIGSLKPEILSHPEGWIIVNMNKHVKGLKSNRTSKEPSTKTLFCQSPIFDKEVFHLALKGTSYENANIDYYHEAMNNWSNSNSAENKRTDWVAVARTFMLRDIKSGNFVTKDFKPNNNGQQFTKNNGTGGNVDLNGAFRKIDDLYRNTV